MAKPWTKQREQKKKDNGQFWKTKFLQNCDV
jgi:hypothetical protein